MDEKTKAKFAEIFADDPLNLLADVEPPKGDKTDERTRLIDSFREITDFYSAHQRLPLNSGNIKEIKLSERLRGILTDAKKVEILKPFDTYKLLVAEEKPQPTLDEVIQDDPFGLLQAGVEVDGIFTMAHVKPTERVRPDFVAHRKTCRDFAQYSARFAKIHDDIKNGRRKLVQFKSEDLKQGNFYVLNGVVLFLERSDTAIKYIAYDTGNYKREDGRTRCIFDNGTESSMLFRTLLRGMNLDGFSISEPLPDAKSVEITEQDVQNGYIYVLRSLNRNAKVRALKNLYKIGYCSGDITWRIKNATKEPTYLMSEVEVALSARCYNLSVPYLEDSIHSFFGCCNIDFEVKDDKGVFHKATEWFSVPIEIIQEAIPLIVNQEIGGYYYDSNIKKIIKKT
jgi:hypothetical protein